MDSSVPPRGSVALGLSWLLQGVPVREWMVQAGVNRWWEQKGLDPGEGSPSPINKPSSSHYVRDLVWVSCLGPEHDFLDLVDGTRVKSPLLLLANVEGGSF